jgi:hypothetical protein
LQAVLVNNHNKQKTLSRFHVHNRALSIPEQLAQASSHQYTYPKKPKDNPRPFSALTVPIILPTRLRSVLVKIAIFGPTEGPKLLVNE